MSDMLNKKQDGAIRLFGALSGVDEKYLAACEDDKAAAVSQSGVLVFMRKYGKGMAAVLCLAILGAGYFAMQTGVKYDAGGMSTAPQAVTEADGAKNMMDMEAAASEAPMADAMEESVLENAGEAPETSNSAASGSTAMDGVSDFESEKEKGQENQNIATPEQSVQSPGMVEMTLEEAGGVDVVGRYIPTNWPANGEITAVFGCTDAGSQSVTVYWTREKEGDSLWVRVDYLGTKLPDWVQSEVDTGHMVYEDDFTKEYLESQIKTSDGGSGNTDNFGGDVGVLYKELSGYVLVRVSGSGTADEIWQLMN